jgi:hypothetical protein
MAMSRGLGKLQRAILTALPAHELEKYPGVYDLKKLRLALAHEWGKTHVLMKYGRPCGFWIGGAFTACFSRAVQSLMRRGLLTTLREPLGSAGVFGDVWDWARWRLPYVRMSGQEDKC